MQEAFYCAVIIGLGFWVSQVVSGLFIMLYIAHANLESPSMGVCAPILAMTSSVLLMLVGPVVVAFLQFDMLTAYYKWAVGLQLAILVLLGLIKAR